MKLIDKINSIEKTFLSGEAGSFSGVPTRTLGFWAERELILADTTGTGDRRRFTALQIVEIALIQKLSKLGMPLKRIKSVMDYLRRQRRLKKYLSYDFIWAVIPIFPEKPDSKHPRALTAPTLTFFSRDEGEAFKDSDKQVILATALTADADNTVVLNIGRIARGVLSKL
jgi:DNA-binding transcriptional MerR regulator